MWWGKIIGGIFGALFAGPIGAIFGIVIGHIFDGGYKQSQSIPFGFGGYGQEEQTRIQNAFFTATFTVMGHVAKADGRISEDEIRAARSVMNRMGLSEALRQRAIQLFNEGKRSDFNLDQALEQLVQTCHRQRTLLQMFFDIQMQAALADGRLTTTKMHILQAIAQRLGFVPFKVYGFENIFGGGQSYQGQGQSQGHSPFQNVNPRHKLKEAYALLNVPETATAAEVKRAYRRLMSQNHPDKLVAKGLPDEMMKLATEKTQQIKAAYELIKETHGW